MIYTRHMIKIKYLVILLTLMMILSPMHLAKADKIQKDDVWQYSTEKELINETATDIIQLEAGNGDFLAIAKVDTTRGFQFPYDLSYAIVGNEYNLEFAFNLKSNNEGLLYVSQEGGLPIIADRHFDGTINFKLSNSTWEFSFDHVINHNPRWQLHGLPSAAFATAETSAYDISLFLDYDVGTLVYRQTYIISTNQAVTEKTRNYTITPGDYSVIWSNSTDYLKWHVINRHDEISWAANVNNTFMEEGFILNPSLSLSSISDSAMQLTWDSDLKLPTNITQTEPVIIQGQRQSLGLNQFETQIVTYILVNDGTSSGALSTEDDSPLIIFISSIVLIIFYRTYKKRRY